MATTETQKRQEEIWDWERWDASNTAWHFRWDATNRNFDCDICDMRVDGAFIRTAARYATDAISNLLVEPHFVLGLMLPYYVRAVRFEDSISEINFLNEKAFCDFATLTELSSIAYRFRGNGPAILGAMKELTNTLIERGHLVEEVRDVIDTICALTEGAMSA